jgi:tRNA A-37 threonylcarbamoyl transferase component Bud32
MIDTLPIALAPDPALPARDALLDECLIRDALRRLGADGDADIGRCTLVRVNYQVGKSLRAVFRIAVAGTEHIVAVRMVRPGRSADLYVQAAKGERPSDRLRGIVHLPELECVAWVFPNDRKIATLTPLLEGSAPLVCGTMVLRRQVRVAAYAPEKSATLAYVDDAGVALAYAKVAASYQAERDGATYQFLRQSLGAGNRWLALPRPIHYSEALRTLWLDVVPGRRLTETDDDDELEDLSRLGSAVAAFHGLSVPHAPLFDRVSETRLWSDADILARIRPDVANGAATLARRLVETAPPAGDPPVCLHGDLHPKNAIATGDRIALIDVEDISYGPAAADLGSLVASLLYLHAAGQVPRTRFHAEADAFLRGYEIVRPLPDARSLAWHTAAALFVERASRAVTRVRPLGLAWMESLLAAAHRVLDGGSLR